MITSQAPILELADYVLCLAVRTADRPHQIDRYIDYFGGAAELGSHGETATPYGSRTDRARSARPRSEVT